MPLLLSSQTALLRSPNIGPVGDSFAGLEQHGIQSHREWPSPGAAGVAIMPGLGANYNQWVNTI